MRITSWNFLHGQRTNPAENKALSEILLDFESDLLALQEVDYRQERSGNSVQAREIAQALSEGKNLDWGFAPTLIGTPGFQWRKLRGRDRRVITDIDSESGESLYGIAIASKVPVQKWLRKELGRAWFGMPLLIANEKGRVAPLYVRDEPRVALAAVLDNGWIVINVHLSFVPLVNIYQLLRVTSWAKQLEKEYSRKVALVGDFNLPWGLPTKVTRWKRATFASTYPSWKPSIAFDYILIREGTMSEELAVEPLSISDHRPISAKVQ